jgi:hypothetical protein
MTLKVAIIGVVYAHHGVLGSPRMPMEKVVVDLGNLNTLLNMLFERII